MYDSKKKREDKERERNTVQHRQPSAAVLAVLLVVPLVVVGVVAVVVLVDSSPRVDTLSTLLQRSFAAHEKAPSKKYSDRAFSGLQNVSLQACSRLLQRVARARLRAG